MDAAGRDPAGGPGDRLRAGLARLSAVAGRRPVDPLMRNTMSRLLPALLLALALPAAAEGLEQHWADLIPPGGPTPPLTVALHGLSQLADALEAEAGTAAMQQSPAAPVVEALDGVQVKLRGYIVPLDMSEEVRVTEVLLVPYFVARIHVPPPPMDMNEHAYSVRGVQ